MKRSSTLDGIIRVVKFNCFSQLQEKHGVRKNAMKLTNFEGTLREKKKTSKSTSMESWEIYHRND